MRGEPDLWKHRDERVAASVELAEIVRLAQMYGLPLPVEPTRRVHGMTVHPAIGERGA